MCFGRRGEVCSRKVERNVLGFSRSFSPSPSHKKNPSSRTESNALPTSKVNEKARMCAQYIFPSTSVASACHSVHKWMRCPGNKF